MMAIKTMLIMISMMFTVIFIATKMKLKKIAIFYLFSIIITMYSLNYIYYFKEDSRRKYLLSCFLCDKMLASQKFCIAYTIGVF